MNDHQHQQQSYSAPGRKEDNLQNNNLKDNIQETAGRAGFTPKPTPLTKAFSNLGKNPPTSPLQMAAADLGKNPPKTSLSEAMQMFKVNYQSPSPSLPAQAMLDEDTKDEEKVQMKEGESSVSASSGSTGSLPGSVLGKMEGAFGTSFSDVNVHSNSSKATDMGALAYARDNNIHFAPGLYNPDSKEGQELIGHELTHVVQQRQGRVQATTQAKGVAVNDDPALEQEADVMGKKAVKGELKNVQIGGLQQNTMRIIDNTEEAFNHYYNGGGRTVQLGPNTVAALLAHEDFTVRHQRIITGQTTSKEGFFAVDLTDEIFHVGRTNVNYSVSCANGDCTVQYEFFVNDGFWDVDVVGEKLGVPADGPGRNLELQHGMPYPYAIQRAHLTFKNPGYK